MKRVLVIGNSHAGTLRSARALFEARPDLAVDWLVTPANMRFLVAQDTGEVGPPPAYRDHPSAGAMKVVGHRGDRIVIGDYAALIYGAAGLRPPELIADHPVARLAEQPVSAALLRAMIRHHGNMQVHRLNLTGFRAAGFGGEILCENWPRPCRLPPGVDAAVWARCCEAEAAEVGALAAETGSRMLGHLEGCGYLTRADLARDAEAPNVHGNVAYAQGIVARALELL